MDSHIDTLIEDRKDKTSAWRRDPESSFSDWTIRVIQSNDDDDDGDDVVEEITSQSRDKKRRHSPSRSPRSIANTSAGFHAEKAQREWVYHVHRVHLASGPMKSEYFETLFSLNTSTEESTSRTTTLVLRESACLAFPLLLDYIYDCKSDISQVTQEDKVLMFFAACWYEADDAQTRLIEEAVALLFLADYLRISKLITLAWERVEYLLKFHRTAPVLCREAILYKNDKIIEQVVEIAAVYDRTLANHLSSLLLSSKE